MNDCGDQTDPKEPRIPSELLVLVERLAERVHKGWMEKRSADGWTYGPARDDVRKKHPDMVPYEVLPEPEKEIDRRTACETLQAVLSLGWQIRPAAQLLTPLSQTAQARLNAWQAQLEAESKRDARLATFDMDDGPELSGNFLADVPTLRRAVTFLQDAVFERWKNADSEAIQQQTRHRGVARWAISLGTVAILVAVLRPRIGLPEWSEYITIGTAIGAILLGLAAKFGEKWLAQRQLAERLRILKFKALGFPSLWRNDISGWQQSVRRELDGLTGLSHQVARQWAGEASAEPALVDELDCAATADDLRAFRVYYRIKRQQYQYDYFVRQAAKHHQASDWQTPLPNVFFFVSLLAVAIPPLWNLLALIRSLSIPNPPAGLGKVALMLATSLPLCGLGIRAYRNAFELPRRASIFEAKAAALRNLTKILDSDSADPQRILAHVGNCEFVLEEEHREWCRLQLGTDWFI
jgi:hypothetical protein